MGTVSGDFCGRLISTAISMVVLLVLLLPAATFGAQQPASDVDSQFRMIKGHGVAVCEAYLAVLNRTPLERTPFCSRPDNGPEPDFLHLERQYLSVDQIHTLFTPVWEFMRFDDQRHVERVFHANEDPKKSYWSADAMTRDEIIHILNFDETHIWTYSAPIDIANDGTLLGVLIWQGYGATGKGALCGMDDPSVWTDSYVEQHAFVLSTDGKTIDEQRTRDIFGEAAKGPVKAGVATQSRVPFALPPGAKPFKPLADSIGIFGYRGKYYIQTEDMPTSRNAKPPPVEVFLRENGSTSKVCAYRPNAVPVPSQYPVR